METKPIAICRNERIWHHKGDWSVQMIEYCEKAKINYEMVDPYTPVFIEQMDKYSVLVWCIQNYLWADLLEARNILRIAERKGLRVFPNQNTSWHFDDKIAEMYAFKSIGAPIPKSWAFYLLEDTLHFLRKEATYPLVAKLRCGSGASNVKLLRNQSQAVRYARRMFSRGYDPSPSLLYKAYSKAQSSHDWKTIISRIKKVTDFLYTRSHAKQMPIEKGYCYFQSFVENDGYDIKVIVIGDKLTYIIRSVRKGDFRASGGGDLFYDRAYITKQILESAFDSADRLGLQCVGFDYVVDKSSGIGLIIEMCYGFDFESATAAGGYFRRDGVWIDEPLNIPVEIISNLMHG
ncbi:RimK family alpha-L-glutamate ligase [Parabacteroides sp. APC149_11_2_Y6]